MRNNSAHPQPNPSDGRTTPAGGGKPYGSVPPVEDLAHLEPFCDLQTAIDCVCKALIVDEKIVLKLPDEVNDLILFWVTEQIEIVETLPNKFSEVVAAIYLHAKAVSDLLYHIMTGVNIDQIVFSFHRLNPAICIEDLPEGALELTNALLASFNHSNLEVS